MSITIEELEDYVEVHLDGLTGLNIKALAKNAIKNTSTIEEGAYNLFGLIVAELKATTPIIKSNGVLIPNPVYKFDKLTEIYRRLCAVKPISAPPSYTLTKT